MPYVAPSPMQDMLLCQGRASVLSEQVSEIAERVAKREADALDVRKLNDIAGFLADMSRVKLQ